jgi:hypothetical protein
LEAKEAYKRLDALKEKRQTFDQHYQELGDYFLPNKNTITREGTNGEKRNLHIYDSTGIKSNELLAGALHGMLTNPSAYWFEFTTGVPQLDRDDAVRKWLQECAHVCHEILNGSNFQTEIHELYLDLGCFGTAVMAVEEDPVSVVRFSTKHIKNCWLDENNRGFIDTVFYCYKWKPRQIVAEFGTKTPDWVLEKNKSAPEVEIELLQVIGPNQEYDSNKKLAVQGKKFKSCTYIKENDQNQTTLEEKGFDTFPFITPRWSKATGEVYGRSPAMTCLPDVKMLQEMMKETIRAQQLANYPPLLVPDDGIVGTLRLTPSGINYFRGGQGDMIKPLTMGTNLLLSFETLKDVRERIRDCFYIDQLQLQDGPQMTATEVLQRTEEKIRLLGPMLGRQQSESARPMIDRLFEIAQRREKLPKAPAILKNNPKIDVKYRSMIAKAQLANEANNITRVFQAASPFIQLDPNARHVINADEGVRYIANLYGLPQELTNDKEKVEQIRAAIDEANQAAIQAQQEQQAAEQVSKVAPAAKVAAEIGA